MEGGLETGSDRGGLQPFGRSTGACTSSRAPLAGLQYLRAAAAIAVVAYHSADRAGLAFPLGEAGVDLFFVISGFLMVAITSAGTPPGQFLKNRLLRVAPPYWIATSVLLCGGLAGLFPRMELETGHVLASYLFYPDVHPATGMIWPLLIPGWTLNYEMFFYATFALTMHLRTQVRQVLVLSGCFMACVLSGLLLAPAWAPARFYSAPIILEFVAGMAVGLLWKQGKRGPPRLVGWACLAIAVIGYVAFHDVQADDMRPLVFGGPAILTLMGILTLERERPIAAHRVPMLVGNASYSIYLWHTPAISVVAKGCSVLGLEPTLIAPLGIVFGLGAGLAAYQTIERPVLAFLAPRSRRALSRRSGRMRRDILTPIAGSPEQG